MRKGIHRVAVLLLAVLVCLPVLSQPAQAANITVGAGGVSVSFNCTNSSDSSGCAVNSDGTGFMAKATGTSTKIYGSLYIHNEKTTTVTLKNENEFPILLDYSATLTQGSSDGRASHTGTGQFSLAAGASTTVTVTDKGAGNTSTLSFIVTKIRNNTTYSVTCNTSSYGTYTANNGETTVSSGAIDVKTAVGLTLNVTANDEYTCVGFVDADGNWVAGVDSDGSALFVPTGVCTITPVFAKTSDLPTAAPFKAGDSYYYTWESAYSAIGGAGTVILATTSYELPTTLVTYVGPTVNRKYTVQGTNGIEYIIPAGGSFLIPYDSTYDTSTSAYVHSGSSASGAYATLTVPSGITLKVNKGGTLIVNAQVVGNGNPLEGVAVGTYGKMIVGGTVDVYGSAYARGYIVDANHTTSLGVTDESGNLVRTGRFYARSGSDIHVLLQIDDYRGGNASNGIYESVFPTSNFYFCNIMIHAEYTAGTTLYARYMVSTNEKTDYTTVTNEIPILGSTSESFLQQSGGTITMDYEYSTDKMVIEGENTQITINDITIKFTYLLIEKVMSTSGKEIPICRNLQIVIGEGASLICSKSLKMIPGSSIHLKDGGTMNITGSIYLYDASDYNIAWMYGSVGAAYRRLPVTGLIKNAGSSVAETADATITVGNGCTLTVGGTLLQSTNHSGGVIGEDGAILVLNNIASSGSINETANADGSVTANDEWTSLSGLLAGLSTSEMDYKSFSTSGTGTYYATGNWASDTNAAWYQHVITVDNGIAGAVAVNGSGSVGETDGYASVTRGTGENATTTENVVGYSVNSGSFKFNAPDFIVSVGDTELTPADDGTYTLSSVTGDTTITLHAHTPKTRFVDIDLENSTCTREVYCDCGKVLDSETVSMVQLDAINASADAEIILMLYFTDPCGLLDGATSTVTMTTNGETVACEDAKFEYVNGRYLVSQPVASGEMTSPVIVTFTDAQDNVIPVYDYIEGTCSDSVTKTVTDYAERVLAVGADRQKNIIKALVTYGGYSQINFGTNVDNPAYSILGTSAPELGEVTIEQEVTPSGSVTGLTQDGQQAFLDSAIYLRVYFVLSDGSISDYTFNLKRPNGSTATLTPGYDSARDKYYVDILNIPAAYMDDDYTITVTRGTETFTVKTSVFAYLAKVLAEGNDATEAQKNAAKAMYLYGAAATEFFGT